MMKKFDHLFSVLENILEVLKKIWLLLINTEKIFLSLSEACEYLGISEHTMYSYTSKRFLPYYKLNGRKLYFKKSDLDAFILDESNRYKSNSEIESEAANRTIT